MQFTKKKNKAIVGEDSKDKKKKAKKIEENGKEASQEEMDQARDMLSAMMGPPEDEMPSTFMLYGDVNEERAADIVSALLILGDKKRIDKAKERLPEGEELSDIQFYISTYGGSADDMMAIYDMMRITKKNRDIETIGMGKIMSAGTLLLASGTQGKRKIMKNCRVMLHAVSAGSMGSIHNLVNEMEEIQNIQDAYIRTLCAETLLTKRQLKKMLDQKVNVYLTAEEAVEYGLADEVI
jgi:ATP-dependent Clp endopeptidase proteolytic subunit ClpP